MRAAFHTSVAVLALLTIPIAASAADLSVKARPAPPPLPPPFSWTGFYIGGNLGGAWVHSNVTDRLFGLSFNNGNNRGVFIGGGQTGFNYQFTNFVVGVEGDFDWSFRVLELSRLPPMTSGSRRRLPGLAGRLITGSSMARPVVVGSAATASPSPMSRPAHRSAPTTIPAGW
jgi:opacity protein-like surface antigen